MGENSKIEWTHHTFNGWIGCTKVHAGCAHCYAEDMMAKRYNRVQWGPNGTRSRTSDSNWREPLKWDKEAAKIGERRRVFCSSLADVFEDWTGPIADSKGRTLARASAWKQGDGYIPTELRVGKDLATMNDLRADLFRLIDATPNLDWLLLTKRPENVRRMWPVYFPGGYIAEAGAMNQDGPRPNVWLGTSIADQATADVMVPRLLECRDLAPVLFLSCEPLLGPIDLAAINRSDDWRVDALRGIYSREHEEGIDHPGAIEEHDGGPKIDWVIVGGESGHGARPMHPNWARNLRDQCKAAGVAFHFKQWGEWAPDWAWTKGVNVDPSSGAIDSPHGRMGPRGLPVQGPNTVFRVGKHAAGRLLDGVEWNEFPQVAESA